MYGSNISEPEIIRILNEQVIGNIMSEILQEHGIINFEHFAIMYVRLRGSSLEIIEPFECNRKHLQAINKLEKELYLTWAWYVGNHNL